MKQKNVWRIVARVLMIVGAVFIAIGIGYEAVNYPWRTLTGSVPEVTEMKEPKPLPIPYFSYHSNQEPEVQRTELPAENQDLPLTRPELDLTLMGTVKIPKLGITENIVQGVDQEILYAVGHDPNTAEPGQVGNAVLAGHRNYLHMHPFKHLPKMELGDKIYVEMEDQQYTYEVYDILTVKPEDVWVTQPQPEEERMLTLITCTPIPSYADRLIVWAKLVDTQPLPY